MEWLESMHRIRALKLELARMDPRRGMPIAPPAGASEEAIAGVERRLGMALPPSYRELLSRHDGWPQLFAGASLLGVRALARGSYMDVGRMVLEHCDGEEVRGAGERDGAPATVRGRYGARSALVPFGIDAAAETVFAWDPEVRTPDGELEIILWTNDVGLRLSGFPELLDMVKDMLAAELDDRRRRAVAQVAQIEPAALARGAVASRSRVRAVAVPLTPAPRPLMRSALTG
ncbi:SMI1/KNR4 family protein [Sorangium sp. So ce726]|uniref:SMI1/KNR4 family protein n=1 Tax=Sorangium sp. So ce726 TaxID=3133319 RepID=UPI003F5E4192